MSDWAIAVGGLRKALGKTVALDGVDLAVPAGTVFALLGLSWRAERGGFGPEESGTVAPGRLGGDPGRLAASETPGTGAFGVPWPGDGSVTKGREVRHEDSTFARETCAS